MSNIFKNVDEHRAAVGSALDNDHTAEQVINEMFGPPALTEVELKRHMLALAQEMFERGARGESGIKPLCSCTHMTTCSAGCPCADPRMKGICTRCRP